MDEGSESDRPISSKLQADMRKNFERSVAQLGHCPQQLYAPQNRKYALNAVIIKKC